MKIIKQLTSNELIRTTKRLVAEERSKTLEVLEYLQEIYARRLHLELGYASLHVFLVRELQYSDGAAARRISAMHLVESVPEVKTSIASGALSLSNASVVQGFFKSEKQSHGKTYSKADKIALLSSIEGTSKEECIARLSAASPTYTATVLREMKIVEDDELKALMEAYRRLAMLSDGSAQSIVKSALRDAIAGRELKTQQQDAGRRNRAGQRAAAEEKQEQETQSPPVPSKTTPQRSANNPAHNPLKTAHTRFVSATIKRKVWERDDGRCAFVHPHTKRRCNSTHRIQLDHVIPFALGGDTNAENLRLACRAHNLLLASQLFGRFLNDRPIVFAQ